jgi:hypothetical protein
VNDSVLTAAKSYLEFELYTFAKTIDAGVRGDYFHPMNKDMWAAHFAEFLAERVRKSVAIRASND